MECGGASPTPQVQFQVMPRTSSSGKVRQSLSVSRLNAVTTAVTKLGINIKFLSINFFSGRIFGIGHVSRAI